jgi:hypothetical protein
LLIPSPALVRDCRRDLAQSCFSKRFLDSGRIQLQALQPQAANEMFSSQTISLAIWPNNLPQAAVVRNSPGSFPRRRVLKRGAAPYEREVAYRVVNCLAFGMVIAIVSQVMQTRLNCGFGCLHPFKQSVAIQFHHRIGVQGIPRRRSCFIHLLPETVSGTSLYRQWCKPSRSPAWCLSNCARWSSRRASSQISGRLKSLYFTPLRPLPGTGLLCD